ncbi:hypothetical protein OAQ99_02685 [Candidatus Kapabacteria bacterium]|nr:hypothetical protein [Candidatus Kapabacteria bacterium]
MQIIFQSIIILFLANSLFSEEKTPKAEYEVGIFYGALSSSNNFTSLGLTPNCCPQEYEPGAGYGLYIPINYYYQISNKIYFTAGVNLQLESVDFDYIEQIDVESGVAKVLHSLNSDRFLFGLTTGVSYQLKKFNFTTGFNYIMPLSSQYSQREALITGGSFDSLGTRTRNSFDNETATLTSKFNLRLLSSISYNISIDNDYEVSPNIAYQFDLLSLHNSNNWFARGFFFGLTFKMIILNDNSSPLDPTN